LTEPKESDSSKAGPLRIVLATRNQDKVREIKQILDSLPVEFLSLADFPQVGAAEEDGKTFEENALKKAMHVWQETGTASLADDSGLEVDALDGRPGVLSARFAGEGATYRDNNRKLLRLIEKVPSRKRKARFVCVAVLITAKGKIVMQRGEIEGEIISEPRGSGGFGYDPIFYLPTMEKTVAELDEETKNKISHRARAVGGLRDWITRLLSPDCM
jgi:XTP/dITP diphosphohydrolase